MEAVIAVGDSLFHLSITYRRFYAGSYERSYENPCTVAVSQLVIFSTLSCARVQEYVRENPQSPVEVGVGTAGGALLGGLMFDSAGAALAGGLLGGLAGGVIGNVLESKNEEYASTGKDYNFRSGQKTMLRIEDLDADPSRVTSRDTVHLIARYALLPPNPNQSYRTMGNHSRRKGGR